ncbi:GTPase [uncultured Halopseudomonas sp.]|uniref:YcjF family protein n=1 Tax=uncultured Halopseudomonas sp. TaxID=2901193 RepID=UPI0030EEDFBA|tara:strand:+ start:2940 stop:4052 length:1113 start_codon:yes stop_codon:yes gene_type:complete
MSYFQRIYRTLNPAKKADLELAFRHNAEHLPTLWLIGKTGAGKSTLIQTVTGLSDIEVGRGFRPCTKTATRYDFPTTTPVLTFIDTRGLAEAGYDPTEDIKTCEGNSHALVVVMRADDPEQSELLAALKKIRQSGKIRNALLVHTGIDLLDNTRERDKCIALNQGAVEKVWGAIESAPVDLVGSEGHPVGVDGLVEKLAQFLPIVAELFERRDKQSTEEANFRKLKTEIMWYAGAAGATNAVPIVGLVSVPAIQTKMLHSLANQYGLQWNKRLLTELGSTLGMGFGVQYASRLGLQQLVKLIPVYGQTIGAASAAVTSYGVTYALGRVGCIYFFNKACGKSTSPEELKATYRQAFEHIMPVAKDEAENNL